LNPVERVAQLQELAEERFGTHALPFSLEANAASPRLGLLALEEIRSQLKG
jgi:hypothetical protein